MPSCDCVCTLILVASFNKANAKCRQAEDESDLQTGDEESAALQPRKKR